MVEFDTHTLTRLEPGLRASSTNPGSEAAEWYKNTYPIVWGRRVKGLPEGAQVASSFALRSLECRAPRVLALYTPQGAVQPHEQANCTTPMRQVASTCQTPTSTDGTNGLAPA